MVVLGWRAGHVSASSSPWVFIADSLPPWMGEFTRPLAGVGVTDSPHSASWGTAQTSTIRQGPAHGGAEKQGERCWQAGRGGDPRLLTPLLGSWGSLFFVLAEDPWGPKLGGQSSGFLLPSSTRRPGQTGSTQGSTCKDPGDRSQLEDGDLSKVKHRASGPRSRPPASELTPFPVTAACLGVALGLPGGVTQRD